MAELWERSRLTNGWRSGCKDESGMLESECWTCVLVEDAMMETVREWRIQVQ